MQTAHKKIKKRKKQPADRRKHEMTNERYIHDELYIEVLPTTTAVVVRIFHAHVFDFTYEKPIAQAAIRIKQSKHQQSNNASNCVLNKKNAQRERVRFGTLLKFRQKS